MPKIAGHNNRHFGFDGHLQKGFIIRVFQAGDPVGIKMPLLGNGTERIQNVAYVLEGVS